MKKKIFHERVQKVEERLALQNKKLTQLSTYRLVVFIIGVLAVIWSAAEQNVIGAVLAVLMLTLFIRLVKSYHKWQRKISYDQAQKQVFMRFLARMEDEGEACWKSFSDNGGQYLDKKDMKSKDLDILGRSSLYQYISVCYTPFGKRKLAKALVEGFETKKEIMERQQAVRELIEDEQFAFHLQTISEQMANRQHFENDEAQLEQFIKEAEKKQTYVSAPMKVLSYLLPFITLFALVSAFAKLHTAAAYLIAGAGMLLQLGIGFWQYQKSHQLLDPVYSFVNKVDMYKAFFAAIEEKNFKSDYLKQLQGKLLQSGGAVKGLKALNSLNGAIEVRHNGALYLITSALLMWDVHCKDALEKWSSVYGKELRGWLETAGEFEMLLSLAVMGQVKEQYCFPHIKEGNKPMLSFEALAHPLILEEKVVSNSFYMESGTCIITGSNMSGKTTFLRSIGVNLCMAYAGGVVQAECFAASQMKLFTSMRVEDRVDQGISTFYAELLRIKEMVAYSKEEKPMLVLIDEIFKGTNSKDRIFGAQETIRKLSQPWCNVMVSTHDFELCSLSLPKERSFANYHFEEHYDQDQILFDYHIRKGQSTTTNAQYLLHMAGIID